MGWTRNRSREADEDAFQNFRPDRDTPGANEDWEKLPQETSQFLPRVPQGLTPGSDPVENPLESCEIPAGLRAHVQKVRKCRHRTLQDRRQTLAGHWHPLCALVGWMGAIMASGATAASSRLDADERLLARIRGEFSEMPGLCLTPRQAARLWNVDPSTCAVALDTLVRAGFLSRDPEGSVARRTRADSRPTTGLTG
jgi:hypothetical protein